MQPSQPRVTSVNVELNPDVATSDRDKVSKLFGSAPNVILKAVGRFIERRPGEFDHHLLRLIAAAAPHVRDPRLVAESIDRLPITRMPLAAQPVELQGTRDNFAKPLQSYGPRVRQKLVESLVHQTAIDLLLACPPEHVTPEARAIVDDHLLLLARGSSQQQARAINSPFATSNVVDAVLDRIEQRIERSANGRQSRRLPLHAVVDGLSAVLDKDVAFTTTRQLERAWHMVERCSQDSVSLEHVLFSIAPNPRLGTDLGHRVLDAIGRHKPSSTETLYMRRLLRSKLLPNPEIPESVARRAVADGSVVHPDHYPSDDGDQRLAAWRRHYYSKRRSRSNLLDPLGSDELDHLVARLPPRALTAQVIRRMKSSEALRTVSARAERLSDKALEALIFNENTPTNVSFGTIDPAPGRVRMLRNLFVVEGDFTAIYVPPGHPQFGFRAQEGTVTARERILMADPRMNDAELAQLIDGANGERKYDLLGSALRNPSLGDEVFERILQHPERRLLLLDLASITPSPHLHRRIASTALQMAKEFVEGQSTVESELGWTAMQVAELLTRNGSVDAEVVNLLSQIQRPPAIGAMEITSPASPHADGTIPGYGPTDVVDRILDGRVDGSRVQALVDAAVVGFEGAAKASLDAAVQVLAERQMLTPDQWNALSNVDDSHAAAWFATHPNHPGTDGSGGLVLPAEKRLSATAAALDNGARLPSAKRLHDWRQLPDEAAFPFAHLPESAELVDRQPVADTQLRVLRTPRDVRDAAENMGNCLDGYEASASSGQVLIALAEVDSDVVAVAWRVKKSPEGREQLAVVEINSRFNRNRVPFEVRWRVSSITRLLNKGKLSPVPRQIDERPNAAIAVEKASKTTGSTVVLDEVIMGRAEAVLPAVEAVVPEVTPPSVEPADPVNPAEPEATPQPAEPANPPAVHRRRPPSRRPLDLTPQTPQSLVAEPEQPSSPSLLASNREPEQSDRATTSDSTAHRPTTSSHGETPNSGTGDQSNGLNDTASGLDR